jgi:hypothetical protein
MAQTKALRLLYDPTRHVVRELRDGKRFIVTTMEDQLFRDGLRGTHLNPVRRRQLRDLLDRHYKNVFNQNASQMSEVLEELYPSGDYGRQSLYENIPSLRQKTKGLDPSEKRNLRRIADRLTPKEKEYMRKILVRSEIAPPFDAGLGGKQLKTSSELRRTSKVE